jgi:hypothetical protein
LIGIGNSLQFIDEPGQRQPIAPIGRQVIAADLCHSLVAPLKETARLVDRVDYISHLERLREEVLVNEQVMVRQEDPEAGVGVIPPHDVVVRESLVAARTSSHESCV